MRESSLRRLRKRACVAVHGRYRSRHAANDSQPGRSRKRTMTRCGPSLLTAMATFVLFPAADPGLGASCCGRFPFLLLIGAGGGDRLAAVRITPPRPEAAGGRWKRGTWPTRACTRGKSCDKPLRILLPSLWRRPHDCLKVTDYGCDTGRGDEQVLAQCGGRHWTGLCSCEGCFRASRVSIGRFRASECSERKRYDQGEICPCEPPGLCCRFFDGRGVDGRG